MKISDFITKLKNRPSLPLLSPTDNYDSQLSAQIIETTDEELFGNASDDAKILEMRQACRAGLLLWNDDLQASHDISQHIATPTGSFWHAIMHRREGDFNNANYWWRQTGNHPALDAIFQGAQSTLQSEISEGAISFKEKLLQNGKWLPEEFVGLCARAAKNGYDDEWLKRIQAAEIEVLLTWCQNQAQAV